MQKNVFIVGSGRSGTSLAAGCLSRAGYFMGDHLLAPRTANPKGFFESVTVNEINEEILARYTRPRPPYGRGRFLFRHRPLHMQRWLARITPAVDIYADATILQRIDPIVRQQPFCLKDPRFSYTLPVWRSRTDEEQTVFVCVFRDPATTAASILTECRTFPPLADFHGGISMTRHRALQIWEMMYAHILDKHAQHGQWLFIHYQQLLTEHGLKRLAEFTGAEVDHSFPSQALHRSAGGGRLPKRTSLLYQRLCDRAGFLPQQGRSAA